jgi:hypothetical protein
MKRLKKATEEEFKKLLQDKKIRPASLQDVEGLHHKRALYKHPRTGQYYVEVQQP